MRQVCYSVAMSLDGFIAGPQGEYDWIIVDPDIDFGEITSAFDTLLMGRKSYAQMRAHDQPAGMPGMQLHVISRSLKPEDCPDARLSRSPRETVQKLQRETGKDIWLFGGGELFRSCLEDGLIDRVEVAIVPILLGAGRPMLPTLASRNALQLMEHRVYPKTGTVLLRYQVR